MEEEKKIFINRKIEPKPFLGSMVEIIIPFYEKHALVSRLVTSIFNTINSNKYLVTLIDDGSTNKSFIEQMERAKLPGVRCFKQENKGFGASVNLALKNPFVKDISYVLILHSDVLFNSRNCLLNLGNYLEKVKNQNIGMVSPVTDNPVEDFDFLKAKKGEIKENHILDKNEFLPLYCALCHRDLFKYIGLLDEIPYAGGEAKMFAERMQQKGLKQAVCGSSWIHHDGKATLKLFEKNSKVQKILRKNSM
jgi:GT2 family glycosyltransferase